MSYYIHTIHTNTRSSLLELLPAAHHFCFSCRSNNNVGHQPEKKSPHSFFQLFFLCVGLSFVHLRCFYSIIRRLSLLLLFVCSFTIYLIKNFYVARDVNVINAHHAPSCSRMVGCACSLTSFSTSPGPRFSPLCP